ncbi:CCA tRNA nucleotidyltransferase [Neobacillus terrae]|uniref:CCA tRNA nucleotidyltransferase n=1 Tax=Neobacillus terrae TaxID=3034837 RepID=UPI001408C247|nr:CCA tRNA nucleotidyltransferase [Neobacillus terrae]NHM29148.1 CCA tRNA nucleotidyltransferase [Neobacillus terrae]
MIKPFQEAAPVLKKLIEAGYEAYFVGGSVRDYLLQRPISDVDIATSATPAEVKRVFHKTADVGIEHGTVLVFHNKKTYEITTFRSEAEYEDFRRPKEVSFIRSLKEDLQRRDFTMNAIAMTAEGKLIDPFEGQKSIKGKMIRTVGIAEERFGEDALRMMRAVRFVSQLSFVIDKGTFDALKKNGKLLLKIAVERKSAEFEKLLKGRNRQNALALLVDSEIYSFLPGLAGKEDDLNKLSEFACGDLTLNEMWALLLFCIKEEASSFLKEWKLPTRQIKEIQSLLFFFTKRLDREFDLMDLYTAGKEQIISAYRLFETVSGIRDQDAVNMLQEAYEALPIKNRSELRISGNLLMEWFQKPGGPWVKEMIEMAEWAVLKGHLKNNTEEIRGWLKKCNQS